ncbi:MULTISPECIES: DUF3990 domain-containing protein [unclassified Fibrobacter]|uniref:DUF3990 domain-containing protein n=1 Tax=unclassified Fibrobacter TaxID=2634177 RepID=UPI000D6B91F6|nr:MULTISPECIES: DUF3990 domain-containing protein [unclassified Fibrobacter]PWJ62070.1 uncharacterized protein DUF3990 [Fibrobacter sp. UWR4]PZW67467.1 uncharacterized protein DUF3990 [Fibrobacter sp. UWR1]
MILFHGSDIAVEKPIANYGRNKVDFGQGFYLTSLREQAVKWAKIIAFKKGVKKAFVTEFNFDEDFLASLGSRYKKFQVYDMEWLDYVVDCRNGGNLQSLYDVIEGGVANDNVIDTVENYENGIITTEQALGQLQYKKVNHQICFRSQEVLDKSLSFVRWEEV